MEPSPDNGTLATLWARQNVWSAAAGQLKRRITRARVTGLSLAALGALLGTASATFVGWWPEFARWLAVAAALVLTALPLLARAAGPATVQDWTKTRAVSEALKAEIYAYLAGAGPYRRDDPITELIRRTEEVVVGNDSLARVTAGIEPTARTLPEVKDVRSYAAVRVQGQIEKYYRPAATRVHQRLTRFTRIEVGLTWLAAALASITGIQPTWRLTAVAATLTTIAGAFAVHVAAERLEYQELTFSGTADRLGFLLMRHAEAAPADATDDAFVEDCELVIATENQAWMAKQTAEPRPGQ